MSKAKQKGSSEASISMSSSVTQKNKLARLQKHCNKFPDDKNSHAALERAKVSGLSTRKAPKNSMYPIIKIQTFRGKGTEEKTSIMRIGKLLAQQLAAGKRACTDASVKRRKSSAPKESVLSEQLKTA